MADHRSKTLEKRLGLPAKGDERRLFERFRLSELLDVYTPLADFIVDDYACPTENVSIIVDEAVHAALLAALIKYRGKGRHLESGTFGFFFGLLARDILEHYVKDGMIHKISETKVSE